MRLTSIIFTISLTLLVSGISAQDCSLYFPERVGSFRELRSYDQRDKLSSINHQEILDKTVNGNDVTLKVKSTSYTDDEEMIHSAELELVCKDGVFVFDMKDFLDPNTMAQYEEMGIEITTDNLIYPGSLQAGNELPDSKITMEVKSGTTTLVTITVAMTNRTVEAIEDITTDAGTFSCYKISYDIASKVGFINSNSSAIEWVADGVGIVRSESYNRRGRLQGYSELTSLEL
jgi:hypothetical protein